MAVECDEDNQRRKASCYGPLKKGVQLSLRNQERLSGGNKVKHETKDESEMQWEGGRMRSLEGISNRGQH